MQIIRDDLVSREVIDNYTSLLNLREQNLMNKSALSKPKKRKTHNTERKLGFTDENG